MKKILLLFFMLFGIGQVSALEYSDYSDFSEYTDSYIQSDELTDVKTERRYKYYRLEKELGGYGENASLDYPYIDKEDYRYTDYSDLAIEKPLEKEGRIIETVNGYHYSKVKDINYLKIRVSMSDIALSDIKLLYKGEEVEYDMEMQKVNENFEFEPYGYIKFNFKENLELRYLTLSFKGINKTSSSECTIYINVGNGDDVYYGLLHSFLENETKLWKGINALCKESAYEDFYSEENFPTGSAFKQIEKVTLYKYKDILYRNYKLNKVYYDDYLTMPFEDYIYKDESLYKDYYAKRVRHIIPEVVEPALESLIVPEVVEDSSIIADETNNNLYTPKRDSVVVDKTDNAYKIPSKAIYYPLDVQKIDDLKEVKTLNLLYVLFPGLLLLVILILVLSKLYKKKKERATV